MRYLLGYYCLLLSFALNANPFQTQQQLADFASQSRLWFGVSSNQLENNNQFQGIIRLQNLSGIDLPPGQQDWQIYFHFVRKIETTTLAGVKISHLQGDLHQITPTENFNGLSAGQQLELRFYSSPWIISYSDFMPRAFITTPSLQPEIFRNTDTEQFSNFVLPLQQQEQLLRNAGVPDQVPVASSQLRFNENKRLTKQPLTDITTHIIPTPYNSKFKQQQLLLNTEWQIRSGDHLSNEARYLQQQLTAAYNLTLPLKHPGKSRHSIVLTTDSASQIPAEGYLLQLEQDHILITGKDNAGVFYGIQSLLALADKQQTALLLPTGTIEDQPRANWRGMHYDMSRNFHGKEVTLRLIEQMARYKLNKLHLHLTDDEGWRLEIPGLPELTQIGAYRCFDLTEQQCLLTQLGTGPHKSGSGNGYYSVSDFIEILKFAAERHIEVIPEIDLPGHARAAIKAMEARYQRLMSQNQPVAASQYLLSDPQDQSRYLSVQNYTDNAANVCLESSYNFVEKVIHELQQMYHQAGIKLKIFHMGGDEVANGSWLGSAACQKLFAAAENTVNDVTDLKPYFVGKVAALTHKHGLVLAGWEDGLMYNSSDTFNRQQFANDKVIANVWDTIWEWGVADRAYRLANNGYQVIISAGTHLYFDHPHEAHPEERGYYWASRFTSVDKVFGFMPDNYYANATQTRFGENITDLNALVGRTMPGLEKPQNILGIQGQVWSETIRTAEQLEQMIYPRLLALAERAWHKAAWENDNDTSARLTDWNRFANRLAQREYDRLATAGVSFYLPPPGAMLIQQQLQANSALPGLNIEYRIPGNTDWLPYQQAISIDSKHVQLRTSTDSGISSRITVVTED